LRARRFRDADQKLRCWLTKCCFDGAWSDLAYYWNRYQDVVYVKYLSL